MAAIVNRHIEKCSDCKKKWNALTSEQIDLLNRMAECRKKMEISAHASSAASDTYQHLDEPFISAMQDFHRRDTKDWQSYSNEYEQLKGDNIQVLFHTDIQQIIDHIMTPKTIECCSIQ